MTLALFIEQLVNGIQFGVTLFLMSAGLTLVFGIMNMINLTHGTIYMAGAFLAATVAHATGSFWLGLVTGVIGSAILGLGLERSVLRRFYMRSHLDQVLVTFGLILVFNDHHEYGSRQRDQKFGGSRDHSEKQISIEILLRKDSHDIGAQAKEPGVEQTHQSAETQNKIECGSGYGKYYDPRKYPDKKWTPCPGSDCRNKGECKEKSCERKQSEN